MNKLFIVPLLALFLVGCATFKDNAGKVLASSAATVDASMKGWSVWVAKGQADAQQEAKVKAAYIKYQASISLAETIYERALVTGDTTAWASAVRILSENQLGLLNLITVFTTTPK